MSGEAKAVPVTIMGRELRVSCTDEEKPQLLEAVALVNLKMTEIKERSKTVGVERIAVMAALNIAHELLSSRNTASGFDIEGLRRRMAAMEATLDQALAP